MKSSKLQKKAKAVAKHIERRSVNTSKLACNGFAQKGITYEMSASKLNPEGLGFPDNFMAIMGWSRVKV